MTSGLFKFEGAGNDFLIGLGAWRQRLSDDGDLVRRLCDRHRGIGADGTVGLQATGDRVEMVYRNADGGVADFCANATRCAARAAVDLLGTPTSLTVLTGWSGIAAVVDGPVVSLDLPAPRELPQFPAIGAPGTGKPSMIDVGVPHLVVEVAGLADLDLPLLAPPLRAHPALAPDGANVNFFESDPDGQVKVRSWERGIEGETLCCGSGLVAVALQVMAERRSRRIELVPASGDRLTVEALGEPPGCPTRFTGPARMVARIEPADDFLGAGL